MQVITTKFFGPTNYRGARIKATASEAPGSVTISYSYESIDKDHREAAALLAKKLKWTGEMVEGHTKDGRVYVFTKGDKITV